MQPLIGREGAPKPPGALNIFMQPEGQEKPTCIGWIEDLSYLPDLLETVAMELRDMMVQQHQRQETERRVNG